GHHRPPSCRRRPQGRRQGSALALPSHVLISWTISRPRLGAAGLSHDPRGSALTYLDTSALIKRFVHSAPTPPSRRSLRRARASVQRVSSHTRSLSSAAPLLPLCAHDDY